MNRHPKISISDQMRKAMDDLGAEPLAGSGFEDEVWQATIGTLYQVAFPYEHLGHR